MTLGGRAVLLRAALRRRRLGVHGEATLFDVTYETYDAAHRFDVDDGGVHSVVCRGVVQLVDCVHVGAV